MAATSIYDILYIIDSLNDGDNWGIGDVKHIYCDKLRYSIVLDNTFFVNVMSKPPEQYKCFIYSPSEKSYKSYKY